MNKKLQNKIEKKLDKLSKLLDQMEEARIIQVDESETWDSDALYNLVESLKEALTLLEDQVISGQADELNQPLTKAGLCSLVDDYQSGQEEKANE